ncbi:MAG: hypothetical protein ABIN01_23595 [Ferruginibacter sp.]
MSIKIKKWFLASLHGLFIFILSWAWLSFYTTYDKETVFIEWASIIKRVFLNIDDDPPVKDYLFINLAHDKELIADEMVPGNQVITDRAKLAALFNILKKNNESFKFFLCDVNLMGDSPNDSLLAVSVAGVKKIVFPIHAADGDSMELPKFNVPYALADYTTTGDMFFKYTLQTQKRFPTVPAYMYQQLNGGDIRWHPLYTTDKGRLIFNNFIVDFPIRSHEVFINREYPVVNLSELLLLPEEIIVDQFLKNRMILAGDFDNDVHSTIHGSTTGTLILLNTYFTLKNGYHIVSPFWIIMMLIFFTLISYQLFFNKTFFARHQKNKRYSFIASYLNYMAIMAAISICSYLVFNVYVNILIVALYLNCISFLMGLKNKTSQLPSFQDMYINIKETYFNFK